MSRSEQHCYINRIKLLNFHNFSNVTINVNHGGHLFLLGDNGSGKTTVLDAVHYVLTAGEHMEFNAAARVVGNRQQGRRAQGIITRYNVDTGHMRPAGGVSYAALEIVGANGKLTTAAIGMAVNAPEEPLTRWGIIRDGALEDVPFLIRDPEGERPRDKVEMRKALGGVGYFGQPHSFCNQLADRFLGGRAEFNDFCRFLAIGKAYREIAAHTTDYQELFMRLLPESEQDIFERIIIALKAIDESREDLDNLAAKFDYVNELAQLLDEIANANREAAAFDAVGLFIQVTHLKQAIVGEQENIANWNSEANRQREALMTLEEKKNLLDEQINDLREQDPSNALAREKELLDKLGLREERRNVVGAAQQEQREAVAAIAAERQEEQQALLEYLSGLLKKLPDKSIQTGVETGAAMAELEALIHGDNSGENKLERVLSELLDSARKNGAARQQELALRENSLASQQEQEAEAVAEEKALLDSPESVPAWNGFDNLLTELDRNGIVYTPLYKGLAWHPDLNDDQKSMIEEFIGEELLAIISVDTGEHDAAADIIFRDFPGHRLTTLVPVPESSRELREWATGVFDVNACNPLILDILLRELASKHLPRFFEWEGVNVVNFRSHERGLCGQDARFIGAEARQREQKRKIKAIRAELRDIRQLLQETGKHVKELKSTIKLLGNLERLVEGGLSEFRAKTRVIAELNLKLSHQKEGLQRCEQELQRLDDEIAASRTHLDDLRKMIQERDLQNVAATINELENSSNCLRDEIKTHQTTLGKLEGRGEDALQRIAAAEQRLTELTTAYQEKLFLLENKYHFAAAAEKIEELRLQHRLHVDRDAADKAMECRTRGSAKTAVLTTRIREIIGVNYGFSYDQENNQLFSRDGIAVAAIAASLAKNLEEQQHLISEKTTELFQELILDTMVRTLWEKVHGLEKMQRDINRLLEGRTFGNNAYRISIRPHERYAALVKLIKSFTHYNPDVIEQMRNFFQDYKNDLINTPPGAIPEILDYRNWYGYEMHVYGSSGDGAVMDSRVKSVGSGGEQAVPNYLLVLTIAHFMFSGSGIKLKTLLFDEAFYGIDAQRRDQLMGFATDLGLQLFVASPDQDGVRDEIAYSTSLLVVKDEAYDVHLFPYHWSSVGEIDMFEPKEDESDEIKFSGELSQT